MVAGPCGRQAAYCLLDGARARKTSSANLGSQARNAAEAITRANTYRIIATQHFLGSKCRGRQMSERSEREKRKKAIGRQDLQSKLCEPTRVHVEHTFTYPPESRRSTNTLSLSNDGRCAAVLLQSNLAPPAWPPHTKVHSPKYFQKSYCWPVATTKKTCAYIQIYTRINTTTHTTPCAAFPTPRNTSYYIKRFGVLYKVVLPHL